ncbi:MAG TPA: oligosaccharide flippase family protein [Polyangiaceae bacterium]|nr:oligosaccharide flippase family protein [Polyangiaceae bacterium]
MQPEQSPSNGSLARLVAKNAFYLTVSQALTVPIAIVVNATLARYLGAADFGFLYLASTLSGFGFLLVNWGHESALPALIARDRTLAGALLGSSIAWRVVFAFVVYVAISLGCVLLHYGSDLQWAFGLTFLITGFASLIGACKDTIRGFERTDIPAYVHVSQQFATAALVIPALMLGGRLRTSLLVQIPVSVLILFAIWRCLRPVGVGALSVDKASVRALSTMGAPFVFLGLATAMQPNIDAVFLSRLAPAEVMGWFAVSRRLIGVLLFPASALVGALYPTLCRLHTEDQEGFVRVSRGAFSGVVLAAVPIAMGCLLYPEVGVAMFSREAFGAAEDNLRVLSVFLFLLYFSMPLGTCILAAGRQKAASAVQALCVLVSVVLDPVLVPWFQKRMGNGGIGLCVAAVASEALVVACGVALTPRGIFDRVLLKSLAVALLSGGLMAVAAWLMRPILSPFIAAPLSVIAYGGGLWVTGALNDSQIAQIKGAFLRKFSRAS